MIATIVNCAAILLGTFLGILFRKHIKESFTLIITQGLGLCTLAIGISAAIGSQNMLCVIICTVLGSIIGELLQIEERLDILGEKLKNSLPKGGSHGKFSQAFVSCSLLFCIGAMAVTGSIEAGINGNYDILFSKSVIDGVYALTFAAVMGIGVAFSIFPLFLYQGGLTLLATMVASYLSPEAITEMSAVGGLLIAGIAYNILNFGKSKVKVGNMLPAIFLPLAYLPLSEGISGLFASFF